MPDKDFESSGLDQDNLPVIYYIFVMLPEPIEIDTEQCNCCNGKHGTVWDNPHPHELSFLRHAMANCLMVNGTIVSA